MGSSQSAPPRRPGGAPAAVGATVLGGLGLSTDDELLELSEIGVAAFDAALAHHSPDLLADFLEFAGRRVTALTGREVDEAELQRLPGSLLAARLLPAGSRRVQLFLDETLEVLGKRSKRTQPELGPMARSFLDHALAGHREAAIAVVVDAARSGTDLAVLLTDVLEPAQNEIGRLWEEGVVSVAQEHYCTAVTQFALSALHPFLFAGHPGGPERGRRRRLVAAQAAGSLHEVGLRMVVDLLEHDGWDTTYLGAVTDPAAVLEAVVQQDAQILALSASMPNHLSAVGDVVTALRSDPRTRDVKVAVGGRPFLVAPVLAKGIGADGVARDAREAVVLCARLVRAADVPA